MSEDPVTKWTNALGRDFVRGGNKVIALIDKEIIPAMYEAIQATRSGDHFIYLLGWQLDVHTRASEKSPSLADLLTDAAKRGVEIRAMVWKRPGGDEFTGRSVQFINSLKTGWAVHDGHTWSILASHHQKVLVVKSQRGLVAFCGGADITGILINTGPGNGSPYHDVSCRIQGPSAYDLLRVFLQRWSAHPETMGSKLRGDGEGPPDKQGDQYVRIARTFNYLGRDGRDLTDLVNLRGTNACKANRSIAHTLEAAISKASRFIYIEDQYMVHPVVANLLAAKVPTLQHLTILIPHELLSDWPNIKELQKRFVNKLNSAEGAKDRVRIFVRISHENPPLGPHTYVHSKTWIVDDELAVIGSANLDWRGWSSDSQANACIFDAPSSVSKPSFAQQLRMRLWAEHLGVSDPTKVADGLDQKKLWLNRPPEATVHPWDTPLPPGRPPPPGVIKSIEEKLPLKTPPELLDINAEFLKSCSQAYLPIKLAPMDALDELADD